MPLSTFFSLYCLLWDELSVPGLVNVTLIMVVPSLILLTQARLLFLTCTDISHCLLDIVTWMSFQDMLDLTHSEQDLRKIAFPWDFPGGPVVKTLCFHCRGCGFDPCSGNQDPTCLVATNKSHHSLPALFLYFHPFTQAAKLGVILIIVCLIPPSVESSSKFCWFFFQGISFLFFFFFLTAQCGFQALSSLTRNRTWARGSESTES